MENTSIEWTERTWNPVRGCSRISPGCMNCYAERQAARNLPGMKSPTTGEPFSIINGNGPHWTGKVELIPSMLDIPLKRRKPTTYFVNSMSDLFHEGLSDGAIDSVFARMALGSQHTFQVLTKRSQRLSTYFESLQRTADNWAPKTKNGHFTASDVLNVRHMHATFGRGPAFPYRPWPIPNVWLGVSVEDQQRAYERVPDLLKTPASVRFLSIEPLLGPVNIEPYLAGGKIHWVIVGGESGPGARPMHPQWARDVRDQCEAAGVPYLFKQWGKHRPIGCADPDSNDYGDEAVATSNVNRVVRVWPDGRVDDGNDYPESIKGAWFMEPVGKKKAGRLLDGQEWNQMPSSCGVKA